MRKPLSSAKPYLATMLLCLAIAACKPAQDAAPASDAAAGAAAGATPDGTPATADHDMDGDIIASTNEPFWSASVSGPGPTLVLSGIDGQRTLAVASGGTVDGTRTLVAVDANGKVELKVTATECQDSMSGAMFPFSAVLVIDGGAPINGCARPASMPPPGKGL